MQMMKILNLINILPIFPVGSRGARFAESGFRNPLGKAQHCYDFCFLMADQQICCQNHNIFRERQNKSV